MTFGGTSGVAINSKGHIFVLHRGPNPLMEFDAERKIHSLAGRRPVRPAAWAAHRRAGQHLGHRRALARRLQDQSRGTHPARAGRAGHRRRDALLRSSAPVQRAERHGVRAAGEIFVVQGHGRGEPKVVKFDKDGNFIKAWGKKGTGPGEFDIAHSIAIDAQGLVYVADRNNQRIQVFDADGKYLRESKHPGTPCGLFIDPDQNIWLAHGHAGRLIKLDLNGNVLGSTGSQGKGARPVRRGAFPRRERARRRLCRRHAELAGTEVRTEIPVIAAIGIPDPRRRMNVQSSPQPGAAGNPRHGARFRRPRGQAARDQARAA